MNFTSSFGRFGILSLAFGFGIWNASPAFALDMDWSGQFRSESHWIVNYAQNAGGSQVNTIDSRGNPRIATSAGGDGTDNAKSSAGGYYIPPGGTPNAFFQTLFLKLRPNIVVNDNIYIRSEWWVGDPVYGLFGGGFPVNNDQRHYNTTYNRGSSFVAHRYWGEFLSDFGTIQVGRAPLHWGLGLVWDNGDSMFSRYASTGDLARVIAKFGSFTFTPAYIVYGQGNSVGGSCPNPVSGWPCSTQTGSADVKDLSFALMYENLDEDIELGVNLIRRMSGSSQDPAYGLRNVQGGTGSSNYNTWDIYGKKVWGPISFAGEIPIATGDVGGVSYKTWALGTETKWQIADAWDLGLRAGYAPGQESINGPTPNTYRAFYYHHNYKIALIMFNYQLRNFSGPNTQNNPGTSVGTVVSPFDNPITNAQYASIAGGYKTGKWKFRSSFIYAKADKAAEGGGTYFFNTWDRKYTKSNVNHGQGKNLGWEMDYGSTFQYDETFSLHLDLGWFFPGDYYRFSNSPSGDNSVSPVFASLFRVGVAF